MPKLGDASIAAPFTSKFPTCQAVIRLIRQVVAPSKADSDTNCAGTCNFGDIVSNDANIGAQLSHQCLLVGRLRAHYNFTHHTIVSVSFPLMA